MSESSRLDIRSSLGSYSVHIEQGFSRANLLDEAGAFLLVDSKVLGLYPWIAQLRVVRVDAEESNKNLEVVGEIIEKLRDAGAQRNSHLIAVGGGIVQDLATFVASSYMRGIAWTYWPTTLLGMVDSCIGGKSSLNVGKYKNIAGNFHPPQAVIVDPDFCASLARMQIIEGLCEAIKICFASQDEAFESYLSIANDHDLLNDSYAQSQVIALSLKTKKVFIEEDEFDNGIRLLLNFGHTFGHAIEAASDFKIGHGIAVGLGMLAALSFSIDQGYAEMEQPRINRLVNHILWLLKQVPNLATELKSTSPQLAAEKFRSDKKHREGCFVLISFNREGCLERRSVASTDEVFQSIIGAFEQIKLLIE